MDFLICSLELVLLNVPHPVSIINSLNTVMNVLTNALNVRFKPIVALLVVLMTSFISIRMSAERIAHLDTSRIQVQINVFNAQQTV